MKLKKRVKFSICEREKASKNRIKSDYGQLVPRPEEIAEQAEEKAEQATHRSEQAEERAERLAGI